MQWINDEWMNGPINEWMNLVPYSTLSIALSTPIFFWFFQVQPYFSTFIFHMPRSKSRFYGAWSLYNQGWVGCVFKKNYKCKIVKAPPGALERLCKAERGASSSVASWEILLYTFPLPGTLSQFLRGTCLDSQVPMHSCSLPPTPAQRTTLPSLLHYPVIFSSCPLSFRHDLSFLHDLS